MNKKAYIAPHTKAVLLRTRTQLLTQSYYIKGVSTVDDGSTISGSRRHKDFWDDEEEDY